MISLVVYRSNEEAFEVLFPRESFHTVTFWKGVVRRAYKRSSEEQLKEILKVPGLKVSLVPEEFFLNEPLSNLILES